MESMYQSFLEVASSGGLTNFFLLYILWNSYKIKDHLERVDHVLTQNR